MQTGSRLKYFLWLLTRRSSFPEIILRVALRVLGYGVYHGGIRIVVFPFGERQNEAFVTSVRAALDLISTFDARRYSRVQLHLRTIAGMNLRASIACYHRIGRVCVIDWSQIVARTDNAGAHVLLLAVLLIHEATHGVICDRFIVNDHVHKQRVEALCKKEERRFRALLDSKSVKVRERLQFLLQGK